jgi:glycosyltransferase involved in cell wall biosynthesis
MTQIKKILQISPFEPPASGWTKRIKLLRAVIAERGGVCDVLDIGPNRKLERSGCVSVHSGADYLRKLFRYARQDFTFHCHINAEYFRGLLLALAACLIGRLFRNRVLTTFHGGAKQRDLEGWRRTLVSPFFKTIFSLSDAIICNSAAEKRVLSTLVKSTKIFAIPAFSKQYLDFSMSQLEPAAERFIGSHEPVISTYLCFRDGFFTDTVIHSITQLALKWPNLGLVVVGTGNEVGLFQEKVAAAHISDNVYLCGDMDHSSFMTLISKSMIHLRTPITDGVSATVLEALSLRIPVVASENGNRPATVVTYIADDPNDLTRVLNTTLNNHAEVAESVSPPAIDDTAVREVELIFGNIKGAIGAL